MTGAIIVLRRILFVFQVSELINSIAHHQPNFILS